MKIFQYAKELSNDLSMKIEAEKNGLLFEFPIDEYIKELKNYPELGGYKYCNPRVTDICDSIVKQTDESVLELYHQCLLCALINKAEERLTILNYPEEIKGIFIKNFQRIINQILNSTEPKSYYLYPNDPFCKDLSVCAFRLIPLGCRKIELAYFPKKVMVMGGINQFLTINKMALFDTGGLKFNPDRPKGPTSTQGFKKLLLDTRLSLFDTIGFRPLFFGHIDPHDSDAMSEWNYEGRIRAFVRTAKLLQIYKYVGGTIGAAWFHDPRAIEISPHLAIHSESQHEGGAKFFKIGTTDGAITDALSKSKKRKKLYEEGKYMPTIYMYIWPRKQLLSWASKMEKTL